MVEWHPDPWVCCQHTQPNSTRRSVLDVVEIWRYSPHRSQHPPPTSHLRPEAWCERTSPVHMHGEFPAALRPGGSDGVPHAHTHRAFRVLAGAGIVTRFDQLNPRPAHIASLCLCGVGVCHRSPNFCLIGNCINQFLILPGLLYMAWATKDPSLSNTEWLEQPWGGVSDPAFRYETWVMWMFCGFMVKDIPWCWVYNGPLVIQHHITVYVNHPSAPRPSLRAPPPAPFFGINEGGGHLAAA